jgi:hypothetical protein
MFMRFREQFEYYTREVKFRSSLNMAFSKLATKRESVYAVGLLAEEV